MGLFNNLNIRGLSQSGNVLLAMFAAVGMVGVVGATGMNVIKGPVRSMHNVTQRTIAENNMIASAKLAIISAAQQGDCDGDTVIEPIVWNNTGTGPKPSGGGYLPSAIGASLEDPWKNPYGYCVWDHGTAIKKTTPSPTCPTPADRLSGVAGASGPVIAVLSAGPDRVYQTTCGNGPTYITKASGSDDIVMMQTYAEASALAAGLWNLKSGAPGVAEINKDIEVKSASNAVVMKMDSTTAPTKPSINVDYIKSLNNAGVEMVSPLTVLGMITGTSFTGDGAALTNLNATNLATGTLPSARISGSYPGITGTGALTAGSIGGSFGNINIGANTITANGSGLTNLNATNLATGTVATARLGSGTANTTTFLRGDGTWAAEADPQVSTLTNGRWCRTDGTTVICDQTPPLMSFSETDPQVSTLTNGRWCRSDGTSVICDQTAPLASYTESDPQVSTLTNGRWCRSDGTSVICDQNVPLTSYTETDPQINAVTNGQWCRGTGSQVTCDQTPPSGGGLLGVRVFASSGTFTPPSGATSAFVVVVGGGGGGGNGGSNSDSGSGKAGGAGGRAETRIGRVVLSGDVAVTVGDGGNATVNGTESVFGSITAGRGNKGGNGGNGAGSPGSNGTTQTGSGGSLFKWGSEYGNGGGGGAGGGGSGSPGQDGVVVVLSF